MSDDTRAVFGTPDEFIGRALSAQSPKRRQVNVLMSTVMSHYVPSNTIDLLSEELDKMIDHMLLETGNQSGVPAGRSAFRGGRVILVQGPAGSGKTYLVNHVLKSRPEFEGKVNNEPGAALLSLVAPSAPSSRSTAAEFLDAMDTPCPAGQFDAPLWLVARRQLQARGIRVVLIDEMQHASENSDPTETKRVASALKRLLEDKNWPVWIIVSGLPEVAKFLQDDPSMRRRLSCVTVPDLLFPHDIENIRQVVRDFAGICPGIDAGAVLDDEFIGRLMHAALHRLGILIEYVQDALKMTLADGRPALDIADFGDVYAFRNGVDDDALNPFMAKDWFEIDVSKALYKDDVDEAGNPLGKRRLKAAKRVGDTR
jgi:hypothetical protein